MWGGHQPGCRWRAVPQAQRAEALTLPPPASLRLTPPPLIPRHPNLHGCHANALPPKQASGKSATLEKCAQEINYFLSDRAPVPSTSASQGHGRGAVGQQGHLSGQLVRVPGQPGSGPPTLEVQRDALGCVGKAERPQPRSPSLGPGPSTCRCSRAPWTLLQPPTQGAPQGQGCAGLRC